VVHVFTECEKLAQGEYKKRHNDVACIIHKELCKIYSFRRERIGLTTQQNPYWKMTA